MMSRLLFVSVAFAVSDAFQPISTRHGGEADIMRCMAVDPSCVSLVECDGSPDGIADAASHLVDCFWLNSPQQLVITSDSRISGSARSKLVEEQSEDLRDKFGERLGKRVLDSMLIKALDDINDETLGMVGIEVRLLDQSTNTIFASLESEDMLRKTVASLGPKQRRQYKDATVQELATELLPPEIVPIVLLSNLSVSPKARRLGLAQRLCEDAERVAISWGYTEIFLKVEAENEAARALYEGKMMFREKAIIKDATAIRVNADGGEFVEVQADTLVLTKTLKRVGAKQIAL